MAAQISPAPEHCNNEGKDADASKQAALPGVNEVTLTEIMRHQDKAEISLADGFDGAEYEIDLPEKEAAVSGKGTPQHNSFLNGEVNERLVTAAAMLFG